MMMGIDYVTERNKRPGRGQQRQGTSVGCPGCTIDWCRVKSDNDDHVVNLGGFFLFITVGGPCDYHREKENNVIKVFFFISPRTTGHDQS